jgi:hypothetical protein
LPLSSEAWLDCLEISTAGPHRRLNSPTSSRFPREAIEALGALEPVWGRAVPAEQARILRLLIERIYVAPDGISITLHAAGIRSLVAELTADGAAEAPILEAAE